jgi:hypothetical protein
MYSYVPERSTDFEFIGRNSPLVSDVTTLWFGEWEVVGEVIWNESIPPPLHGPVHLSFSWTRTVPAQSSISLTAMFRVPAVSNSVLKVGQLRFSDAAKLTVDYVLSTNNSVSHRVVAGDGDNATNLRFQTVADGVISGGFNCTIDLSLLTCPGSICTVLLWAIDENGLVSNEESFKVNLSNRDPSWLWPTPSPSPVARLRVVHGPWYPWDVRATVDRDEIGFTLNNHGYSIAAVSGKVGSELFSVMDVNGIAVAPFHDDGLGNSSSQTLYIYVISNVDTPRAVNISFGAIITTGQNDDVLLSVDRDKGGLNMSARSVGLEWVVRGIGSYDADAIWIGDAADFQTRRWTQGTELGREQKELAMAFSWFNVEVPPRTAVPIAIEVNAWKLPEPSAPMPITGSPPPTPSIRQSPLPSNSPRPSSLGTDPFTAPLIRVHFQIRRVFRMAMAIPFLQDDAWH